ncbi:MAG: SUMF1/EgtB/PvdO family nonheme iron enzyme [Pirellulales bacterium]|nr:SUMF1/EgtB/PvdO family nonheme iron enzyme [Pirellulales bacterium]
MSRKIQAQWLIVVMAIVFSAAVAQAGVIIETVPVGNLGNADDTHGDGYGGVSYAYDMGKFEVTAGQYRDFLNAVAKTDTYGLYNPNMDGYTYGCQITQNGPSGSYYYDFSGRPSGTEEDWEYRPVNYVSWGDAARFANWLHNGKPSGSQNDGTTEDGAYDLSSTHSYYNPDGSINDLSGLNAALMAVVRESDATWVIPTEDEWYKAAYHKKADGITGGYFDYPTTNDSLPSNDLDGGGNNATYIVGTTDYTIGDPYYRTEYGAHTDSESPYGTFDQGGNVFEWNETIILGERGMRGGAFDSVGYKLKADYSTHYDPTVEFNNVGFRVAIVPEPGSITLLLCGLAGLACWRHRR